MKKTPFLAEDLDQAKALIQNDAIKNIIFSDRTYQIEVKELVSEDSFWIFLQLSEDFAPKDYFCTCEKFESTNSCPHLYAGFLKIFKDSSEPLHLRFKTSLWNQLCQIEAKRHGYEETFIEKKSNEKGEDHYVCRSSQGKVCFSMKVHNDLQKKWIHETLYEREEETEESSLKFSNLSPEELTNWRRGRPSHYLKYELSFWSDIAKYMMWMYEEEKLVKMDFKGNEVPNIIELDFQGITFQFFLAKVNLPDIIPTLIDLPSPLKVYPFQKVAIENITYDEKRHEFQIKKRSIAKQQPKHKPIPIDNWLLVPEDGFYPKDEDPMLQQDVIESSLVPQMLRKYSHLLHKYLTNAVVNTEKVKPSYQLYFDQFDRLHITMYIFEEGDLFHEKAHVFDSWVYLPEKGFYLTEDQLFNGSKKIIEKENLSEFISHHRLWLNQYEGFQTHIANIETKLTFYVDDENNLCIESDMQFAEDTQDYKDFGEWIYIPHQGFYSKSSKTANFPPKVVVPPIRVSDFIYERKLDLEQIKGFFAPTSPIDKSGLDIRLENNNIVISPIYMFSPNYVKKQPVMFSEHSYVTGEGFCEIPPQTRLPKEFRQKYFIQSEMAQNEFISEELPKLEPYILHLDSKLKKPSYIALQMSHIREDPVTGNWLVSLVYKTEFDSFPVSMIWKAIRSRKKFLMTKAGLFNLKQPRFDWLKTFPQEKFSTTSQQFEFSTIEFMRLKIFEDIQIMPSEDPSVKKAIAIFRGGYDPSQDKMPNIKGLKSTLRPYQEVGVKWLWHLYQFNMSGLLADDMGLGKTHQAMALLACMINEHPGLKKKYLVICPTSVIYHWEDLLERFFPKAKVLVFYGSNRSLSKFNRSYQILLTSYGTLRSEIEAISKYQFELSIFDEMQMAKNKQSQVHKSLKQVNSKIKVGLTGTPVENYLKELKALFDIILPGYFPSDSIFRELFINPIEKYQSEEKKALLFQLISPFIMRRKKTEVLDDLPEKIEEISYVELSDHQKQLYKQIYLKESEFLNNVEKLDNQTFYTHVFALLSALKQVCNHPALFKKDSKNFHKHESGKFEYFKELIQDARSSGQKVVVFTQYLDMMNIIEAYLEEEGIGFAEIRGSTKDRKQQVLRFKEDPKCEVFVASLQAAGVGIDLVAASVVIHYDRWWNPAKEDQATDRVHRIGQVRGVQVFKLVSKHTIEEHIDQLINKKMDLIQSVVGYDGQEAIKSFDRDDLLKLLKTVQRDIESLG